MYEYGVFFKLFKSHMITSYNQFENVIIEIYTICHYSSSQKVMSNHGYGNKYQNFHIILVFSTTFGAANLKKTTTFNVLLFKFMIIIIFGCMLFPGVLKSHGAWFSTTRVNSTLRNSLALLHDPLWGFFTFYKKCLIKRSWEEVFLKSFWIYILYLKLSNCG